MYHCYYIVYQKVRQKTLHTKKLFTSDIKPIDQQKSPKQQKRMEPKIPLPPQPSSTMIPPPIHLPMDFIKTDTTRPPQQKPPSTPATTKTSPSPSKPSSTAHHLITPDEQSDDDDDVIKEKIPEENQIQAMEEARIFLSKCKNDLYAKN